MNRRHFLKGLAASLTVYQLPAAVLAANQSQIGNKKVVWVLLRGAMDGLHTVIPAFDSGMESLRPTLFKSVKDTGLPLSDGFLLHPSLKNLHNWYQQQQLLPVVAVSSGYQSRSHFDGQDYLESGKTEIDHDSGWLGRLIETKSEQAIAVSRTTPISLRGSDQVTSWYPGGKRPVEEDTLDRLMDIYQNDPAMLNALSEGMEMREMAEGIDGASRRTSFTELAKTCGMFLSQSSESKCAMLEFGGWDTHNNQVRRLENQFEQLDNGLAALRESLGDDWQNTVVVVATEFGRTARENGTGGSDHGTASSMFIAGGAIKGGRVLGDWPGLANEQLFEERDLMPTSNSLSWIGNLMKAHWSLTDAEVTQVFPAYQAYSQTLI